MEMDRGTLRRGFYDFEIPEEYKHLTYMECHTEREHLKRLIEKVSKKRKEHAEKHGLSTNREDNRRLKRKGKETPEILAYFKLGYEKQELQRKLAVLNKYLKNEVATLPEVFIRAAKDMLPNKKYMEIKNQAIHELNEKYKRVPHLDRKE